MGCCKLSAQETPILKPKPSKALCQGAPPETGEAHGLLPVGAQVALGSAQGGIVHDHELASEEGAVRHEQPPRTVLHDCVPARSACHINKKLLGTIIDARWSLIQKPSVPRMPDRSAHAGAHKPNTSGRLTADSSGRQQWVWRAPQVDLLTGALEPGRAHAGRGRAVADCHPVAQLEGLHCKQEEACTQHTPHMCQSRIVHQTGNLDCLISLCTTS